MSNSYSNPSNPRDRRSSQGSRLHDPRGNDLPRSHGSRRSTSSTQWTQVQPPSSGETNDQPPSEMNEPQSSLRPSLSHFMAFPIMQDAYHYINTSDSLDSMVYGFWNTLLLAYFKTERGFMVVPQSQPSQSMNQQKADLTVKASLILSFGNVSKWYSTQSKAKSKRIRADKMITVMIAESKRGGLETQSAVWDSVSGQLDEYLYATFAEGDRVASAIYGAVVVGTYVRFYCLDNKDSTLQDLGVPGVNPKPNKEPWEAKHDTEEIHKILEWLEQQVVDAVQGKDKREQL